MQSRFSLYSFLTFSLILPELWLSRKACAIEDPWDNSLILTGGSSSTRVTKYFQNETFKDLPTLNLAREEHACGIFLNTDWFKVCKIPEEGF